ncbi:MAG TPA: RHS repeat-associated core domain-containing protein, partial [Tepidisphaeraceae bacterium]|nr:RHS repeat-associated core domain-containing protein [Tepidisphaeraceae bacterium]
LSAPDTDADAWIYGFQGGRFDTGTGLYAFGYRDYSVNLGRWVEPDPTGTMYVDGANLYQGFDSNPTNLVDPAGGKSERQKVDDVLNKASRKNENQQPVVSQYVSPNEPQYPPFSLEPTPPSLPPPFFCPPECNKFQLERMDPKRGTSNFPVPKIH